MSKEFVMKVFVRLASLLALLCVFNTSVTWAQEKYPSKPIKIVVPYDPGGVIDLGVRAVTDSLAQELKVPMTVENKSGAGGMIGASEVLRAKPDGYTLLAAGDAFITAPLESPNPPFDPIKDFVPICGYGGTPAAFAVHKASPLNTIADLVKEAKATPGKLTVAVTSIGGENHLSFEAFRKLAGVNLKLVPYKGTGEAVAALLGRHVDVLVLTYVGLLPYVKTGEMKIIVVSSAIPGSSLPNFADAGYAQALLPRVNGFLCTVKTPKSIYDELVPAFKRAVMNPDVAKKWDNIGLVPEYRSPSEYTQVLKQKWETYGVLMEELGLRKKK
jgi:tripartite-type tricarboxylate transporter receptor subunit TctC